LALSSRSALGYQKQTQERQAKGAKREEANLVAMRQAKFRAQSSVSALTAVSSAVGRRGRCRQMFEYQILKLKVKVRKWRKKHNFDFFTARGIYWTWSHP
jgi:hypothetical protein